MPTLRELYERSRSGRLTLPDRLYLALVSARPFAWPWAALLVLFGAALAGIRHPYAAAGAVLAAIAGVTAGHYRNNYRDLELGVDRPMSSIDDVPTSAAKPYTAAAILVPLGITSARFQRALEYSSLALSLLAALLFLPLNPLTVSFYALGVAVAELYTDVFKRRGLGELAIFLGYGVATVGLGCASQGCPWQLAALAGIPPGALSALSYGLDQFVDIRDNFVRRVRAVYESWFNSRMPVGLYIILAVVVFYNLLIAYVAAGLYPRGTLLSLAALPIVLFYAPMLDYDMERALGVVVPVAVWLLPLTLFLGALL
jgi:1,4-dihydroxy-2-naphthoate octaprenyltransferase